MPLAALADGKKSTDVLAVGDPMREHGVLRRVLLVYVQGAGQLCRQQAVPAQALRGAGELYRYFW